MAPQHPHCYWDNTTSNGFMTPVICGLYVCHFREAFFSDRRFPRGSFVTGPDSMDIPFVKKPVHYYTDRSLAPEWLRDAEKRLETCDGFIYFCPQVNRSIPPNLSDMVDHSGYGSNIYQAKPAAIITYSDSGNLSDIYYNQGL